MNPRQFFVLLAEFALGCGTVQPAVGPGAGGAGDDSRQAEVTGERPFSRPEVPLSARDPVRLGP